MMAPTTAFDQKAPYFHFEGHRNPTPDWYTVCLFHEGHLLEGHREFMPPSLDLSNQPRSSYNATLTEEQREQVREDPGVRCIFSPGNKMYAAKADLLCQQGQKTPWRVEVKGPGYLVSFASENKHNPQDHMEMIGLELDYFAGSSIGYATSKDLSERELASIFSDENVELVEENSYMNPN